MPIVLDFLRWLFSPEVTGIGAVCSLGIGYAMGLASTKSNIKLGHVFFGMAAVWFYGAALEWLMKASLASIPRPLIAFIICGSIGAGWMWAYGWVEKNHQDISNNGGSQQEEPKKPDIQQKSEGSNSPNIVGNNNTVTINPESHPPQPTFHEKADVTMITFSFGEGGIKDVQSVARLRKGIYEPFKFAQNYKLITLHMKGDTLLFHFTVWGGQGKPPIEVHDNEFTVRLEGFDRNSSANALEVVNPAGVPIFQMIRKTPTNIVVNGVFPTPAGVFLAGPDGLITGADAAQLAAFRLKPIFKYPSWKYPGQYLN